MDSRLGKVKISWSYNFAYAIGLIVSDGNLNQDKRHIFIKSADRELIQNYKKALDIKSNICRTPSSKNISSHFYISHSDQLFWKFLTGIGIFPAKSKTIRSVSIPEKFFGDFLRGFFDGDGTFYSFWDTRWPKSFAFQISFPSASADFVHWLKEKLANLYGVKGFIRKGDGVYLIRYVKGDSKKIVAKMYWRKNLLCLGRKYNKIMDVLEKDRKLRLSKGPR